MRTRSIHSVDISTGRWNEDDLVQRLSQTLDFAEQTLRQLTEDGSEAFIDHDGGISIRPEKVIAETGVLLLAASNVSSYSAIGPRIFRVATLLEPHAHSPHMLRGICLEPAMAFDYATAHICLKRLGYYDPDFDAMLDLSLASQASEGRERAPHRMLEQEWLKQGWLYPEGLPRLRANAHLNHCSLNRTIDLLHGSREDVYGFTHSLMYLRDFNLFPRPLPRSREELLSEAEGMLARCLDEQDYDLAGEVLLAWPLTGESWSPAAAFAFRVLCQVEQEAGFLPTPTTRIDRIKSLDAASGRRYFYATAYHTVYVMGLLCAAALTSDRRPPVSLPKVAVRDGAFEAVIDCFLPHDSQRHWQQELDKLEPAERESLASFLLSMALHREFARRDFAAIERILSIGNALSVADTPVASQAAEMMSRVRQFADHLSYQPSATAEAVVAACA